MKARLPDPFPGFHHICLYGIDRYGVDQDIRSRRVSYRGQTHKWLFHDLGRNCEMLDQIETGVHLCDFLVGRVENPSIARRLRQLGKPVLDLNQATDNEAWNRHCIDYEKVGHLAADHLCNLGHRHFGFLTYHVTQAEHAMWQGFYDKLSGTAQTLCWIERASQKINFYKPTRRSIDVELIGHWFPEMPRPMAIFSHNDASASTLSELAFFKGVAIPEEISLLSTGNDVNVCNLSQPNLSSISLPGRRLGYEIGEYIDHLLGGKKRRPTQWMFRPIGVISRRSTDLLAIEDPLVSKALHLMRHNAASGITVKEIVDQLPISSRGFSDRFKKALNRSPREELVRLRVGFAKEKLLHTNHTVDRIAADSGFPDAEAMAHAFRNLEKCTPSHFRHHHQIRQSPPDANS